MKTSARFVTFACVMALLSVTAAGTGCAADPEPEATDSSSEAFVLGGITRGLFPGSDGVCEALSLVAAGGGAAAVNLATATGGCAAGALVTTAGVAEPVCLLPAAGAALTGLAALLAGGAASLVCRTARAGYSQVAVEAAARSRPGQRCDDSVVSNLQWFMHSANACGAARGCARGDSCAVISQKLEKGASCIDSRRRIQECFDPHSADAGARKSYADHEAAIGEAKKTVIACRSIQQTIGCP